MHRLLSIAGLVLLPLLAHAGIVNINTADAATLARELSGVGDVKAAAIVEYRQKHGQFKTIDDLALVPGIGSKFVERNRANLRIDKTAAAVAPTTTAPKAR
ncbi:MAG: helix-hairpin-helix domain-containing protein [Steroidobacteraceae bacterium]